MYPQHTSNKLSQNLKAGCSLLVAKPTASMIKVLKDKTKNTFFGSMLNFFRPIDRCLEFGLFLQGTMQQSYVNDNSSVINITFMVFNTLQHVN